MFLGNIQTVLDSVISPIAPPAVGESAWRHMFGHLSEMTGCFVTETKFAKIMKESRVSAE